MFTMSSLERLLEYSAAYSANVSILSPRPGHVYFDLSEIDQLAEGLLKSLAQDIKDSTSLQCLRLTFSGDNTGDRHGVIFASAIKEHQTLEEIGFFCMETGMGNRTGILLAEAIQANSPLRRFVLDCSDTNMDSEVGTALARSVAISSVRDFELHSIGATVGTASAWAHEAAANTSLKSFNLVCSEADKGMAQWTTLAMRNALESNGFLKTFEVVCYYGGDDAGPLAAVFTWKA